jgi:hypothetical protein
MARGFSTVAGYGAGTTGAITSATFTCTTTQSISCWVFRDGFGGADTVNSQVLWGQPGGDQMQWINSADARNDKFSYIRVFTGNGNWYWDKPTYKTWVNVIVTLDATLTTNIPVAYYNAVSQTVSTFTAPTGTVANVNATQILGNRAAGDRVWNGIIAEFAVWNRILTSDEITALGTATNTGYGGASPALFPSGLLEYIPMDDSPVTSKVLTAPTVTGTTFRSHPVINYGTGQVGSRPASYPKFAMNTTVASGRLL